MDGVLLDFSRLLNDLWKIRERTKEHMNSSATVREGWAFP